MLIDVRLAHFTVLPGVEIPSRSLHRQKGNVGRMLRSMYGCRDAGVNWIFAICQVMTGRGFVQGGASPCMYHHSERQLRVWVHGDDLVPLSPMSLFLRHSSRSLVLQVTTTVCLLGRIADRTADGITWEANPRHAGLIRQVREVSWHQRQG